MVDAYQQLLQYREALKNPPLLVVCDLDRFEVHTNFTGTVKVVHAFDLGVALDERANVDDLGEELALVRVWLATDEAVAVARSKLGRVDPRLKRLSSSSGWPTCITGRPRAAAAGARSPRCLLALAFAIGPPRCQSTSYLRYLETKLWRSICLYIHASGMSPSVANPSSRSRLLRPVVRSANE